MGNEDKIHPKSLKIVFITILITAAINTCFWFIQYLIQHDSDLRTEKYQIVSSLLEETEKIEILRNKSFWSKYYATRNFLSFGTLGEFGKIIEEYRTEYEDVCAKYKATLYLSYLYFDQDIDTINKLEKLLSEGFPNSSEFTEIKYKELIIQNDSTETFKKIEDMLNDLYDTKFYSASREYTSKLVQLLK